ncbi:MAG: hypothetical protein NT062_27485 [Proteobacteria bacterium]|nr:hypothetical protein [Pseudomonadota bacterium]
MSAGARRLAAVLGFPIAHSRSPAMHNAAFAQLGIDAVMLPFAIAPGDLVDAIHGLRAMRALGASVTIPHKVDAVDACDALSDDARAIGAVNCLQFDGARIVGHNTDAGGFVDGLRAAGFEPTGKRVVILGGGGAARAIAHGVGAADVVVRRPDAVAWTTARAWTDATLRAVFRCLSIRAPARSRSGPASPRPSTSCAPR